MKKLKDYQKIKEVDGWAKMYYGFYDLTFRGALMLNYLIDTEAQSPKCRDKDFEEYYRYTNEYIQNKLNMTAHHIREAFKELEEKNYILPLHYTSEVLVVGGSRCDRIRYVKLNHIEIAKALGVELDINADVNADINVDVNADVTADIKNFDIYNKITDKQTNANKQINTISNSEEKNKSKEVTKVSKEVYDYFNQTLGTNYKYNVKGNKDRVKKLLDSGYTLEDIKTVIDKKTKQWKNDPKMKQFLTPTTLLGDKFDTYLNQEIYVSPESKLSSMSIKEVEKNLKPFTL